MRNPRPMIRVGSPGDKGSVEISDLLFTASGPTAGMVAVEWNIEADSKGSAGMWGAKFVVLHTPISLLTREQIRISASVARKAAPSKLPTAQNQRVRLVANAWGHLYCFILLRHQARTLKMCGHGGYIP